MYSGGSGANNESEAGFISSGRKGYCMHIHIIENRVKSRNIFCHHALRIFTDSNDLCSLCYLE